MNVAWSYVVPVPTEAVFEYYRDPVRSFVRDVPAYRLAEREDFLAGSPVRIRGEGSRPDWTAQLIESEPPRRIVIRVWPSAAPDRALLWTHRFEAARNGTAVTVSVEGPTSHRAGIFFALARPFEAIARRRWVRKEIASVTAQYAANGS